MLRRVLTARAVEERRPAADRFQLVGFDEKLNLPGEALLHAP
jgi:hypothetical protein